MSEQEPEWIAPSHAGQYIQEILDGLEMTVADLAAALKLSEALVSDVVNGRTRITAEFAIRLGRYFESSPEYWMGLQTGYDLEMAEHQLGEQIVREIEPRGDLPKIIGADDDGGSARNAQSAREYIDQR